MSTFMYAMAPVESLAMLSSTYLVEPIKANSSASHEQNCIVLLGRHCVVFIMVVNPRATCCVFLRNKEKRKKKKRIGNRITSNSTDVPDEGSTVPNRQPSR